MAFATQVLAAGAWNDTMLQGKFWASRRGLQIDQVQMNVDGGSISLGHPVCCIGNGSYCTSSTP